MLGPNVTSLRLSLSWSINVPLQLYTGETPQYGTSTYARRFSTQDPRLYKYALQDDVIGETAHDTLYVNSVIGRTAFAESCRGGLELFVHSPDCL